MITDQTYQQEEADIQSLFEKAGWSEVPVPNEIRIGLIEERALHERITKESADFIFTSFGTVITSFTGVLFGSVISTTGENYRA